MERTYTVEGIWPFPLDMLRHDEARAATPEDQVLIDRLSGDVSDDGFGMREKIKVRLIMEAGDPTRSRPTGRFLPNDARWKSFDWMVLDVPEIDEERAYKAMLAGKPVPTLGAKNEN